MRRSVSVAIMLAVLALPAVAQPPQVHAGHPAMAPGDATAAPHQMGQPAFAAIQEIVGLLQADPTTDWSRVDIEALRQHLIDMDNVVLRAAVSTTVRDGGVIFDVSGEGAVRESIRRMITAQAATAHGDAGSTYKALLTDRGAMLIVETTDAVAVAKLKALGYFGLVAQGPHHQVHHMMIARGQSPH